MNRRILATIASLSVAVSALVAAPATAAPVSTAPAQEGVAATAETAASRLSWGPCSNRPRRVECATLAVPRDWANPSAGPRYSISVARIRAAGPVRLGVLTFNPGGPGAPGVGMITRVHKQLPRLVRSSFDLVAWDPRGVGSSQPNLRTCPAAEMPDLPAVGPVDWKAYTAGVFDATAEQNAGCLAVNKVDSQYIGTWQVIRDLDALRAALGEQQITFWGMSYGSTVGRAYAQQFPQRLRTLVLDGTISPTPSILSYSREHIWDDGQAVETMVGALGRSSVRTYNRVIRSLERRPLEIGDGGLLTRWEFVLTLTSAVAYQQLWPAVKEFLAIVRQAQRAGQPDATTASRISDMLEEFERSFPVTWRAGESDPGYTFINCADMHDRPTATQLAAVVEQGAGVAGTAYGLKALFEGVQCAGLPTLGTELPDLIVPLLLPTPPVIINSVSDNRTPWYGARMTANVFTRSSMVSYAGTQHVTYAGPSTCVDIPVTRYLLTQELPPASVACPLEYQPPPR